MAIHVDNPQNLPESEVAAYVARTEDMIASGELDSGVTRIVLLPDGDEISICYFRESVRPFDRIRRITGYLTGTLDTWNDAKRAEERDRVKHGLNEKPPKDEYHGGKDGVPSCSVPCRESCGSSIGVSTHAGEIPATGES